MNAPRCIGKSKWRLETVARLFGPCNSSLFSGFKYQHKDHNLVCSMVLSPGIHTFNKADAVYFFDTRSHLQQPFKRLSGVPLCKFMQRDGCCRAGDCCKFSHASPACFSPEVPVYIGHMLEQCQSLICRSLRLPLPQETPFLRSRVYSKYRHHGMFPARRRVASSGVITFLILRLICPGQTKRKARALAASQYLPMQIYRGLALQADDFNEHDASLFVDCQGYRFMTLLKHPHTCKMCKQNAPGCGTVGCTNAKTELDFCWKQLPEGWEICPPDDVSIAVCAEFAWQSTRLMLSDGGAYETLGCICHQCAACSALPKMPSQPEYYGSHRIVRDFILPHEIQGSKSYRQSVWKQNCVPFVGVDVLLRRRHGELRL